MYETDGTHFRPLEIERLNDHLGVHLVSTAVRRFARPSRRSSGRSFRGRRRPKTRNRSDAAILRGHRAPVSSVGGSGRLSCGSVRAYPMAGSNKRGSLVQQPLPSGIHGCPKRVSERCGPGAGAPSTPSAGQRPRDSSRPVLASSDMLEMGGQVPVLGGDTGGVGKGTGTGAAAQERHGLVPSSRLTVASTAAQRNEPVGCMPRGSDDRRSETAEACAHTGCPLGVAEGMLPLSSIS